MIFLQNVHWLQKYANYSVTPHVYLSFEVVVSSWLQPNQDLMPSNAKVKCKNDCSMAKWIDKKSE